MQVVKSSDTAEGSPQPVWIVEGSLPALVVYPRPQQHVPGSEAASSPPHSTLP